YFVTGDYVVGGAVFNGSLVNGLAQGTISIPDTMQGQAAGQATLLVCPGRDCPPVPDGAIIVGAFFIWGTVESTLPGAITGQVGTFGANGNTYSMTGTPLGNPNAPTSWSSGGCSGPSGGSKTMHVYAADVRPFLLVDANGRVQGNGTFQV